MDESIDGMIALMESITLPLLHSIEVCRIKCHDVAQVIGNAHVSSCLTFTVLSLSARHVFHEFSHSLLAHRVLTQGIMDTCA